LPLLYEPDKALSSGIHRIGFKVKYASANPEATKEATLKRLQQYNWLKHGLKLLDAQVNVTSTEVRGIITLKVLPAYVPWLAIAVLVPSILGFVSTIAQLWVIREITNPLLAPGPLGLPMIAWVFITAAGVLIPIVLIRRK